MAVPSPWWFPQGQRILSVLPASQVNVVSTCRAYVYVLTVDDLLYNNMELVKEEEDAVEVHYC